MLSQQQWSGIGKSDVEKWISNFKNMDDDDKSLYFAYKLLVNIIYYSEKDVIDTLKDGINNFLFRKELLQKQIESNFQLSENALLNIVNENLSNTCFVPLLDVDAPHESGNYISRILVQNGIIEAKQSFNIKGLHLMRESQKYSKVVIVDDCIGSGDQIRDFWQNNAQVTIQGKNMLLKEYCKKYNIDVCYLTIFAFDKIIDTLNAELEGLDVYCIRSLTESQRVFSEESYIWKDNEEREAAELFFRTVAKDACISFLGHFDLDFAFIMHKTIPDWSLPILWRKNSGWKYLLRRKNSDG